MSFDARSLERLQQLGRSLPKPLPKPDAAPAPPPASQKRHRVETETDPEALFRELMQVSPDGSVPPHLLDRLRLAEADRQRAQQAERLAATTPTASPSARSGTAPQRPNPQRRQPTSGEELELYTAFQQLLLEDEED